MATRTKDTVGLSVAFLLGGVVGALLASPVLPQNLNLTVGGSQLGPTGSALLVAVLVVVAIPLGIFLLYGFFASLE